jgi:hypothetical protein
MFLSHFSTLRNIGHVKKNLLVSSDYYFVHISLNLSLIFPLFVGAYNTYILQHTVNALFFFFSSKLSHVPFVLARDHLGKLVMEK